MMEIEWSSDAILIAIDGLISRPVQSMYICMHGLQQEFQR